MLYEAETEGDDAYTFEQFLNAMVGTNGINANEIPDNSEDIKPTSKLLDKDGICCIDKSELKLVLQCLGEELTEEDIDDMIAEVSLDEDNKIDSEGRKLLADFIACLKSDDFENGESSCDTTEKEILLPRFLTEEITDLNDNNLEKIDELEEERSIEKYLTSKIDNLAIDENQNGFDITSSSGGNKTSLSS